MTETDRLPTCAWGRAATMPFLTSMSDWAIASSFAVQSASRTLLRIVINTCGANDIHPRSAGVDLLQSRFFRM